MPLSGTESVLAKAIAGKIAPADCQTSVQTDWEKIAKAVIDHIVANGIVTGTCDGKPLVEGKIT